MAPCASPSPERWPTEPSKSSRLSSTERGRLASAHPPKISLVPRMTFEQARACVLDKVASLRPTPTVVEVLLDDAEGRTMAEWIVGGRVYQPKARSVGEGFAF